MFIKHLVWTNHYAKHFNLTATLWGGYDYFPHFRCENWDIISHWPQGNVHTPYLSTQGLSWSGCLFLQPQVLQTLLSLAFLLSFLKGSGQAFPPPGNFPWPQPSPFPVRVMCSAPALPHGSVIVLVTGNCSCLCVFDASERVWVLWEWGSWLLSLTPASSPVLGT